MSSQERRRALRTDSPLLLEVYNADGKLIRDACRLINVSETGARFETAARLTTGHTIWAHVRLDGESFLKLPARIVWMRSQAGVMSYGLEFSGVSPEEIERLKAWLRAQDD